MSDTDELKDQIEALRNSIDSLPLAELCSQIRNLSDRVCFLGGIIEDADRHSQV